MTLDAGVLKCSSARLRRGCSENIDSQTRLVTGGRSTRRTTPDRKRQESGRAGSVTPS